MSFIFVGYFSNRFYLYQKSFKCCRFFNLPNSPAKVDLVFALFSTHLDFIKHLHIVTPQSLTNNMQLQI